MELYPFKFFDPLRKRWIQARYKATREEIAARYAQWEITGPPWTPPDLGGTAGDVGRAYNCSMKPTKPLPEDKSRLSSAEESRLIAELAAKSLNNSVAREETTPPVTSEKKKAPP